MTKEVLKMALEAFESIFASTYPYREDGTCTINDDSVELSNKAISAIEEALAQRTWVGLTDDEIVLIVAECAASHQHTDIHFAKAIEAKLKEKNT